MDIGVVNVIMNAVCSAQTVLKYYGCVMKQTADVIMDVWTVVMENIVS